MVGKNSGKKKKSTAQLSNPDMNEDVRNKEDTLKKWLNPWEAKIMSLQSVLVWEKPQHSAGLFFGVHILFWLASTLRVFYTVGIIGTIVVFMDMWHNHIWPEIRVPVSPEEDMEGWTPVHPTLLSVPEICQHAARWWSWTERSVNAAVRLRQTSHFKFFVYSMLILCSLAAFGHYVPGIYLSYLTVMGLLLGPCALYHNLLQRAYTRLFPVIADIETKLKIRRKRTPRRTKRKRGEEPRQDDDSESDEEIECFVPAKDPMVSSTLDQANTDSDGEGEGYIPGLLTPPKMPSASASREHSDLELDEDMTLESLSLSTLTRDLEGLPSYDDSLDATSLAHDVHEMPSYTSSLQTSYSESIFTNNGSDLGTQLRQEMAAALEEDKSNSDPDIDLGNDHMTFVSSHFKEDSPAIVEEEPIDSQVQQELDQELDNLDKPEVCDTPEKPHIEEEETLGQGLTFPDVVEEAAGDNTSLDGAGDNTCVDGAGDNTNTVGILGSSVPETAHAMVTSGLSAIQSQGQALAAAIASQRVTHTVSNLVASIRQHVTITGQQEAPPSLSPAAESEFLDNEFEFLNQEDFAEVDAAGNEQDDAKDE